MTFPAPRLVETNGLRLAVHEAGDGAAVVLLHGFPELAFSWRHQFAALAGAGFRVIAPDQRGYGGSDKPDEVQAYDIRQLTADIVGLLDALGLEDAFFAGHDWGAIVTWHLALMYPERVRGAIALSVPYQARGPGDPVALWEKQLGPDFYIVHFNRRPGVAEMAFERDPALFLSKLYRTEGWLEPPRVRRPGMGFITMMDDPDPPGRPLLDAAELQVFADAFTRGGFAAPIHWYRNFTRNWALTADLDPIVRVPALMIYGRYDSVPRFPRIGEFVPALETHELDCGHWIQQERSAETTRLILDWLRRMPK